MPLTIDDLNEEELEGEDLDVDPALAEAILDHMGEGLCTWAPESDPYALCPLPTAIIKFPDGTQEDAMSCKEHLLDAEKRRIKKLKGQIEG